MEWIKCPEHYNMYYKIKKFNSTMYRIEMGIDFNYKTIKTWVALSSGKKRRDLKNFMPDDVKRDGGIKALLWVKEEILNWYKFFDTQYKTELYDKLYICIHWEDSKRRDVYSRLEKEGFQFMQEDGHKVLRKEIKL